MTTSQSSPGTAAAPARKQRDPLAVFREFLAHLEAVERRAPSVRRRPSRPSRGRASSRRPRN